MRREPEDSPDSLAAAFDPRRVLGDDVPDADEVERRKRRLQKDSFDYFLHETRPATGLVRDKTAPRWPASIAAMGMALSCYPVGVHRGYIPRLLATRRTLATLRFLAASEQGPSPTSTGHRGFYYHYLDLRTGKRAWDSELSSIDTAILAAGMLVARAWFDRDTKADREIRALATELVERIDWPWMLDGQDTFSHGWKPESGFLGCRWRGYDEALILHVLALGSRAHAVEPAIYDAWCRTFEWKSSHGREYLYAGPLFIHQISQIWCDLKGPRDAFMRARDCDYFENSRRATYVHRAYAIENPMRWRGYGEYAWGLTASDGPGPCVVRHDGEERTFHDYVARGAPFGPDDGTIAPWVVAASLPFAPEIVVQTLHRLWDVQFCTRNRYGFKASFNPSAPGDSELGWVSPYHFGINEGPTVLMIENFRSGLLWKLLRRCPTMTTGLRRAGFTGGWLEEA